jgi:ferredoxin
VVSRLFASIDNEKCMSHQLCIAEFPAAFMLGPDHTAIVTPGAEFVEPQLLIEAAENCPMAAISLRDENGVEFSFR